MPGWALGEQETSAAAGSQARGLSGSLAPLGAMLLALRPSTPSLELAGVLLPLLHSGHPLRSHSAPAILEILLH